IGLVPEQKEVIQALFTVRKEIKQKPSQPTHATTANKAGRLVTTEWLAGLEDGQSARIYMNPDDARPRSKMFKIAFAQFMGTVAVPLPVVGSTNRSRI
ncbi:unnamed protein product, partial [Protopolystoma xenopodis]